MKEVGIGRSATRRMWRIRSAVLALAVVLAVFLSALNYKQPLFVLLGAGFAFLAFVQFRTQRRLRAQEKAMHDSAGESGTVPSESSTQIEQERRGNDDSAPIVRQIKSEFIATISHEVRTPMNAVLGMADLLQLTSLTRKQQDYVRTIQSSGGMLLSLVDNALDYSALENGEVVLRNEEFDLPELVERVLEIMGFQASSKGLELACRIDAGMPSRIFGDENRLRQVLVNLISNAIRFTSEGEVIINIRTRTDMNGQASWLCSVMDSGIGISDEASATLFEPFVRADRENASRKHGSGLGLTICKWLIEGMGGSIDVDSERGNGACVWFRLPLAVATNAGRPAPANELQGESAIIVHENPRVAAIISDYLSDWGLLVDRVEDADAALECLGCAAARGQPYRVAIVDAKLPRTGGLSLVRRIRAEKGSAKLPIVLLTPIAEPLEVGQISSIGGIRCVNKPVLPSELRRNLLKLMSGSEEKSAPVESHRVAVSGDEPSSKLRILVAEDNPLNRQLLLSMLQSLDYLADSVEDGPSVLEAMRRKPYDLILMDCQMPEMDGDEVTRHIRNHADEYRSQPIVVAVTADVSTEHKAACNDAGMNGFIAKPIRLENLKAGLQRWSAGLGRHKTEFANAGRAENGAKKRMSAESQVQKQLQDRAGVDEEFLRGYIELFLEDTQTRLKILGNALGRDDWDTLRRESHALKGACLEMGASAMGTYCAAICEAPDGGKLDDIPSALDGLKQEFERIKPVFEAAKIRSC